jgi:glutamate/tyrosine decarboxylase-like PLP-dependent enzyme
MLPLNAPEQGESWDNIMKDVEDTIMPGITHWQHPRFHAYFPAGNSYPSILGEMFSAGLGIVGFSWAASPACTELEPIMLDWLGRMMSLPKAFLPFNSYNENTSNPEPVCESICEGGGGVLLVRRLFAMIVCLMYVFI